jgi:hypothetical protein
MELFGGDLETMLSRQEYRGCIFSGRFICLVLHVAMGKEIVMWNVTYLK